MRQLEAADLAALLPRFAGACDNSLFALSTVFGHSRSELEAWLGAPATRLFVDAAGGLLLEVADLDLDNATARVQLCGAGDIEPVEHLLHDLTSALDLQRLYAYVFPWESREKAMLTGLGYAHEATFREHLYGRAGYQDIEVFGRLEGRA